MEVLVLMEHLEVLVQVRLDIVQQVEQEFNQHSQEIQAISDLEIQEDKPHLLIQDLLPVAAVVVLAVQALKVVAEVLETAE
tara:strand:+ start:217 stop:459 length:243 start_codon:yes stop_codon:yes gene_type:complete